MGSGAAEGSRLASAIWKEVVGELGCLPVLIRRRCSGLGGGETGIREYRDVGEGWRSVTARRDDTPPSRDAWWERDPPAQEGEGGRGGARGCNVLGQTFLSPLSLASSPPRPLCLSGRTSGRGTLARRRGGCQPGRPIKICR
ncbi:hypothetical protein KM043_008904 [Ampulex compressa]|nr:hypothetical protein KM043_008904 [Ampulex compressa]